MKKFWKIIVLTIIACWTMAAIASAAPTLVDTDKAIKSGDAKKIEAKIEDLKAKYDINVGVLIMPDLKGQDPEKLTKGYLDQNKYGEAKNGGVVLMISPKSHKWFIEPDKKLGRAIDKDGVKHLGQGIIDEMKKNKTPGPAVLSFLSGVDKLTDQYVKNGKAEAKPGAASTSSSGKHEKKKADDGPGLLAYLFSFVASIAAAFGYRSYLRGTMSNVEHATEAAAYVTEEGLDLLNSTDDYDHTDVVRTPISDNNDADDKDDDSDDDSDNSDDSSSDDSDDDGGNGGGGSW